MAIGNLDKKGVKSDINITPYIDILLVLLIIFMVSAPLKVYDLQVRVPQPPPPTKEKVKPDYIIVDVGNDHSIRLNQMVVTLQELGDKLTLVFSARGNRSMFIRGFSKLAYGEVFQVLDIAQRSGATNIALIKSDEESAKAQGDQ